MPPKSKSSAATTPIANPSSPMAQSAPDQRAPGFGFPASALTSMPVAQLHDAARLAADRLPALAAIRQCLEQVGGAAALCTTEGAAALEQLAPRERDFALLAASVAVHGVEEPLVVRRTPEGLEIVSGLRRRYAAELAGVSSVPVRTMEVMTDTEAAAYAARANHNRAALTAWQFARLAGATRAAQAKQAEASVESAKSGRVGAPRRADSAASVARVLGVGYTTAKEYLVIATAINDDVLAEVAPSPAEAHVALSKLSFRKLRALAQIEHVDERIREIRLATKFESAPKPPKQRRSSFEIREGREGAYVLRVKPVERLPLEEAERLLDFLQKEQKRVKERVELLKSSLGEGFEQEGQRRAA